MQPGDYYVGIDLGERFSQICFIPGADKANARAVENITTGKGSYLFPNGAPLSRIFKNGTCTDPEQLEKIFRGLLSALKEKKTAGSPAGIGVCLHEFSKENAAAVTAALEKCGIAAMKTSVFSREEAFAGYVYGMPPALRDPGSMVFDYGETGIFSYFLKEYRSGKNVYTTVTPLAGSLQLFGPGVLGREALADQESDLSDFFNESLKGQNCAAIYLTGCYFDTDQFPEGLLKKLCTGRRVFAGQNLYVKGACLLAADDGTLKLFGRSIPAMQNRITAGISVILMQGGRGRELTLVRQGESYLKADRTCYFMEEGLNSVTVLVRDREKELQTVQLSLTGFPARDDRSVRLKLTVHFPGTDKAELKLEDDGFGAFYASTERSAEETVELDEKKEAPGESQDQEAAAKPFSAVIPKGAWLMPAGTPSRHPLPVGKSQRCVWSVEELGYYIYHSMYLIERDFINAGLLQFLKSTGSGRLAANLASQIQKEEPLSKSLSSILKECGLYTEDEISRLSVQFDSLKAARPYQRMNMVAENLIVNDCLNSAMENLNKIIAGPRDASLSDRFYGRVWHNLGIVYTRCFLFDRAAECFAKAFELNEEPASSMAALQAKILARGSAYVSAKAEDPEDVRAKKAISSTRDNARFTAQWRLLEQIESEKAPGKPEEYYSRMGEFLEELKDSYLKLTN